MCGIRRSIRQVLDRVETAESKHTSGRARPGDFVMALPSFSKRARHLDPHRFQRLPAYRLCGLREAGQFHIRPYTGPPGRLSSVERLAPCIALSACLDVKY